MTEIRFFAILISGFGTLVLVIIGLMGPSVPLTPERTWENLPTGAEAVWASGTKRAYRLGGCLWFNYWMETGGGHWYVTVDDDGAPVTDCGG